MADVAGESSPPIERSSAPLEQAISNDSVSEYRQVRQAQRAGKEPPTIAPKAAESAPAEPVEQVALTDASPKAASEPAKPKKNADTRVQELLAERERDRSETARLRAELESLRKPAADVKAESSPAKPTPREFERFKAMPGYPQVSDFDDYGDYTIAVSDFVSSRTLAEFSQKQKDEFDRGEFRKSTEKFGASGREQFPDFDTVLGAAETAGRQWPQHVTRKVLTSEHGPALAYELAKAKDDDALYTRIADPVEFGEYVGEFLATRKAQVVAKPPVSIIKTPGPPVTLGDRAHDKASELDSAVETDDVAAYRAARLRERMAGRK